MNAVEGLHTRFISLLGGCHRSIWKTIETFKKDESVSKFKITQYIAGAEPPKKKIKYREVTRRVQNIVKTYQTMSLYDYLFGLASVIHLNK